MSYKMPEVIAHVLKKHVPKDHLTAFGNFNALVLEFADELVGRLPGFDRDRFLRACGVAQVNEESKRVILVRLVKDCRLQACTWPAACRDPVCALFWYILDFYATSDERAKTGNVLEYRAGVHDAPHG